MNEERAIDRTLDGARILWRHWYGDPLAPNEGHVREFSADGRHVRLSKTDSTIDRGHWLQVDELRLVAVLDPARAPSAAPLPKAKREP